MSDLQSCLTVVRRPRLSSGAPRPVLRFRRSYLRSGNPRPVLKGDRFVPELPRVYRAHPLAHCTIRYMGWYW